MTVGAMDDGDARDVRRWAASGCMHLTGPETSPGLGPPAPLVSALDEVAAPFGIVEPLTLLSVRAGAQGLRRRGRTSCGGATRLLATRDGWVALALPRDDDVAAVPALTERAVGANVWDAVADWCAPRDSAEVLARAVLLGIAAGAVPLVMRGEGRLRAIATRADGAATVSRPTHDMTVVDLSSMWAGPLCGALLGALGMGVVKVESTPRPDGARHGGPAFFDELNGGKRSVAVDLCTREGVDLLRRLIIAADVVIEASRPRALRQLGVDVHELLRTGPRVWVSITGHGSDGPAADRIGFGDDAAAAGGLVADDGAGPWFCADAVADPLSGVTAASEVLAALARGGRWHLEVALARIAAQVTGPTLSVPSEVTAALPPVPEPRARAADLGADTAWAVERTRTIY